jgi:hypothetical protein
VDADIAYFVTYPCPRCQVELESEHGGWQGWLKCPVCDTPALPPEFLLGHPAVRRRVRAAALERGVIVIGDETPDGATPAATSPAAEAAPSTLVNTLRLVFITGLVTSLFLLLIAFVDQNTRASYIFGALSAVFFLLLLRTPVRRRRRV